MGVLASRRALVTLGCMLLALLAGCAATGDKAVAEMSQGKGVVVVRVSTEGLKYVTAFGILVRRVGVDEQGSSIQGWSMGHPEYWSRFYEDTEKGSLVATSLEPGEYEIHGVSAQASAWGGMRSASIKGLSKRFRVEAGRAVYLGNVHVTFYGDRGVLPPHVRIKGYVLPIGKSSIPVDVACRDTRARDFPELPKAAPGLDPAKLEVRLLR